MAIPSEKNKRDTHTRKHIPKSSIAAAAVATAQRSGLRKLFLAIKVN